MASRHLSVLLLILALAFLVIFPGLFALQSMLRSLRGQERFLSVELEDRLDNQDPFLLACEMRPVDEASSHERGLVMVGSARLVTPSYPWKPSQFLGELRVDLSLDALAAARAPAILTSERNEFIAWYRERYLGGSGATSARVPCRGSMKIEELSSFSTNSSPPFPRRLAGQIELRCTSFGRDLAWDTLDDLSWRLSGPMTLRWGR